MANIGYVINSSSSPTITNCVFSENLAPDLVLGGGGGGGMYNSKSIPIVANCIFSKNSSAGSGGGMSNWWDADPTIINCTFSGNSPTAVSNGYDGDSNPTLTNCILWGDTLYEIVGAIITYSDVQGGFSGTGNINADPCFADPCNGDYHLQSQASRWDPTSESWVIDDVTSVAIDAGNMADPIGFEPFPNGGVINMGAYGGTVEASKSYFGTTPCETIVAGDINGDCKVDFKDLALMGKHWLEDREPSPTIISQEVLGCSPGSQRSEETLGSEELRFKVTVQGKCIYFEDMIYANCCFGDFELQMEINGNNITIREIAHIQNYCWCVCDFPASATLGPFAEGEYLLEAIDVDGSSLGTVSVTIGGS
jgi:hypothetical protein